MKFLRLILVVSVLAFLCTDCRYSFIVPEDVPEINPEDPNAPQVSFAQEIQPIFTANCVSCHTTGKQRPDLSEGNAFNSLNSSRYINDSNPAESLIYQHPHPDSNTHKQKKYTAAQAQLVLTWITQGAKNN